MTKISPQKVVPAVLFSLLLILSASAPLLSAESTCYLTLETRYYDETLLNGNIYLDGNWVGQGQWSGEVSVGYHEITFDEYIDLEWPWVAQCWYVNEYGNWGSGWSGYLSEGGATIVQYYVAN